MHPDSCCRDFLGNPRERLLVLDIPVLTLAVRLSPRIYENLFRVLEWLNSGFWQLHRRGKHAKSDVLCQMCRLRALNRQFLRLLPLNTWRCWDLSLRDSRRIWHSSTKLLRKFTTTAVLCKDRIRSRAVKLCHRKCRPKR